MMRNVACFVVFALWTVIFVLNSIAQSRQNGDLRVVADKPSVYIAFEKRGFREPLRDGETSAGIYLRLHNNLKASIRFCAFGISDGERMAFYKKGEEIGLNYEIERWQSHSQMGSSGSDDSKPKPADPLPVGYLIGGFCHYYELASGKSIQFAVPAEHLSQDLYIKIPFKYQWEDTSEGSLQHFVIFSWSELPKEKLPNKN